MYQDRFTVNSDDIEIIEEKISKEMVTVVLKGGAGSGHHGHKGIPGHQGGSLPKGASAAGKIKEPVVIGFDDNPELKNKLKEIMSNYADKYGFPKDKFVFSSSPGAAFQVGQTAYNKAAEFDPRTGEIKIYTTGMLSQVFSVVDVSTMKLPFIENVVAHEVSHYRYNLFRKLYRRQAALFEKEFGYDAFAKDLTSEQREKYWAYDIYERNYQYADLRHALWEDPVSSYGKSYIEVARSSKYGVDWDLSIDENLAEIAAHGITGEGSISPRWAKLYNEINQGLYTHKVIKNYVELVKSNF